MNARVIAFSAGLNYVMLPYSFTKSQIQNLTASEICTAKPLVYTFKRVVISVFFGFAGRPATLSICKWWRKMIYFDSVFFRFYPQRLLQ